VLCNTGLAIFSFFLFLKVVCFFPAPAFKLCNTTRFLTSHPTKYTKYLLLTHVNEVQP
jgi:hypothetical protein